MRLLRARGAESVDIARPINRQYVPVPLGGLAPGHRPRKRTGIMASRVQSFALAGGGVILGAIGALITVSAPAVEVYGDDSAVHIGSNVLTRTGGADQPGARLYVGSAAMEIIPVAAKTWSAAAVTTLDGVAVSGHCVFHSDGGSRADELCTFVIAGRTVSASDQYAASDRRWTRTYGDGGHVQIGVPEGGGVVPIPIPLGR